MKTLIILATLTISGLSFAQKNIPPALGESNPQQCGCLTCLREHGVCTPTKANDDRVVTDKSAPQKGAVGKKGRGAVTQ